MQRRLARSRLARSGADAVAEDTTLETVLSGRGVGSRGRSHERGFALLAGTAVTCTGGAIDGNVGVFPGSSVTQTGCPISGAINAGDIAGGLAQLDFAQAYTAFAALPCDQTLTTLDAQILGPGPSGVLPPFRVSPAGCASWSPVFRSAASVGPSARPCLVERRPDHRPSSHPDGPCGKAV